jgi:ABC-type lipoprotein release transport system permease subunit
MTIRQLSAIATAEVKNAIPFAFAPLNLIWMVAAILLLASLASIDPVVGAMRVKIAQTLRYE